MKRHFGFTLIEVLMVVVIVVSVAAFSVPAYKKTQARNEFLAAKGILMDLGSAVQTFRADLVAAGKNVNLAPANPVNITKTHQTATNSTYKSIEALSSIGALNLTDSNVAYALFARGYLQSIQHDPSSSYEYKGYRFYVCPAGGTQKSPCCRATNNTIACMRKNSNCTSADYPGAYIATDGTLVEVSKTDTTARNLLCTASS